MFGALKEVANPTRCAQVAVVEVLAEDREYIEPGRTLGRCTEKAEDQRTREDGIGNDLDRMFIERRDHFDSGRAVMDLMKHAPERSEMVTRAMPPIENECSDEPAEQTLEKCGHDMGDVKGRHALEPSVPGNAGQHDDSQLREVE